MIRSYRRVPQADGPWWEKMTSTGVVLRLDGLCENFHPSLTSHTRPTRHTGHAAANPQVRALGNDFAGALASRVMQEAGLPSGKPASDLRWSLGDSNP